MILGSHNSWSYLPPRKSWMKPIAFTAKCQDVNIKTQYEKYNVRCFDLRVKFDKKGNPIIAHGIIEYTTYENIISDLTWLNNKRDVYIRVILEARNKKDYDIGKKYFARFCGALEYCFYNIYFWCGRNLYNWEEDYDFHFKPTYEERYSSVCKPKLIDDWYPKLYAKKNNKDNIKRGTDKQILLIDFVNIK
jgi:hypothetical protein